MVRKALLRGCPAAALRARPAPWQRGCLAQGCGWTSLSQAHWRPASAQPRAPAIAARSAGPGRSRACPARWPCSLAVWCPRRPRAPRARRPRCLAERSCLSPAAPGSAPRCAAGCGALRCRAHYQAQCGAGCRPANRRAQHARRSGLRCAASREQRSAAGSAPDCVQCCIRRSAVDSAGHFGGGFAGCYAVRCRQRRDARCVTHWVGHCCGHSAVRSAGHYGAHSSARCVVRCAGR
mmetsp:Transcript_31094/g.89159  ORF Transcript_31094/g.89159 Transcript_31094/m.89159 type:complete len:236 (+) Transcript_31094:77-784(+)